MIAADLPTLIRTELPAHAWRVIYLRYFCAAAVFIGTIILVQNMGATLNPVPVYAIAGLFVAVNLFYSLHLFRAARKTGMASPDAAERSLMLQLAADLFLLTFLLHFSGGVSNPFMVLYGLPILLSGFLLSGRATFLLAALAAILYGGMAWLEYRRVIPHLPVPGLFSSTAYRNEPYLLVLFVAFGVSIGLTAVLSSMLSGRLRLPASEPMGGIDEELIR
jgi:two-component system sensor histidine kinase RegB